MELIISEVKDFRQLEGQWRDLESGADGSFFQSWAWTGCLAEERFPDPVLLRASESDRVLALGLFNRRRSSYGQWVLSLGESGDPSLDDICIENNGILLHREAPGGLLAACLHAIYGAIVLDQGGLIRLSGVDGKHLAAARTYDPA